MGKISNSYQQGSNVISIVIIIIVIVSCSTANATLYPKLNATELNDSLLIDRDGNKYPIKKFHDNSLWMTINLNLKIPGSFCYDDKNVNCEKYGRLYTWETAQNGCALLGEGWRLPTNDEWRQLAQYAAGFPVDSIESRKKAYAALLYGGNSGFDALLSGGRQDNGEYRRLDAHGFYWTATESSASTAWFGNFGKGSQSLYHQIDGEKTEALAVRCLKKMIQ